MEKRNNRAFGIFVLYAILMLEVVVVYPVTIGVPAEIVTSGIVGGVACFMGNRCAIYKMEKQ